VACKELEFVLTLWLVKHPGVCVDTVTCKELEFMLTLASNKYWCICRYSGL
jgi:hypothetical protein